MKDAGYKVGDRVVYKVFWYEIKIDEVEYIVIADEDILAVAA
ncbi:MAG: hypothetical protein ACLVJ6_16575 [Merdibacter sp.]